MKSIVEFAKAVDYKESNKMSLFVFYIHICLKHQLDLIIIIGR